MITLLIGHRGVGKSAFLQKLRGRFPDWRCLDLDQEVERSVGRSVTEIFSTEGEAAFRALELRTLETLVPRAAASTVIALGAGFAGPIPLGAHVVWLRRATDKAGRVFRDRPRLEPGLAALAEYQERFVERDRRYRAWAHEELFLPEGYESGLEDFFAADQGWTIPFTLTLLPENFRDWPRFSSKRLAWDVRFELRDDLLSAEQIAQAMATVPARKILYSRRAEAGRVPEQVSVDWALELGPPPLPPPYKLAVLSAHELGPDLAAGLKCFSEWQERAEVLKAAPEVRTFAELQQGHEWWLENPLRRAFQPRSADGRWSWYRTLFGPRMPLHFLREGDGTSADQPLLWQAVLMPSFQDGFGAVLGDPVIHSRSPLEQLACARERGWPFVAVPIVENEFTDAMEILGKWGLRLAAVTAPLKRAAFQIAHSRTDLCTATAAANTLYLRPGHIAAHNTDLPALKSWRESLSDSYESVVLWGGGGVKSSVRDVWPGIAEVSARSGTPAPTAADLLIWAAGRSHPFQWPASDLRPRLVLDLNYGDDSPGLEWAARENLPYQSGLTMFKLQARFQREFWNSCWREDRA